MMLDISELRDMYIEHLDSYYESVKIEGIVFVPSEILEKFPNAFDKAFEDYINDVADWVSTGEDGYYKLK